MTTERLDAEREASFSAIEVQVAIMARNTELLRRRDKAPEELDRAAYLILRALLAIGPADINRLAGVLGLDSSTVGRQVGGLAEEGLVVRTEDAEDRRRAQIVVSDEGRHRVELTSALRRARTVELLGSWSTDDLERFDTLLTRYNAAVAERYMTGLHDLPAGP